MEVDAPKRQYQRRLDALRADLARRESHDTWLANGRLVVFVVTAAVLWAAYVNPAVPWALGLALGLAFAAMLLLHERVIRAKQRALLLIEHYERAIDRLEGKWAGRGPHGEEFVPQHHTYARDLDIFGEGSVFQMICTARTRTGEHTLAQWLLDGADPARVRQRQQAVAELRPRLDLREDLAVLGESVAHAVDPHALRRWASARPAFRSNASLTAAWACALFTAAAALSWAWAGALPLILMLLIDLAVLAYWRDALREVAAAIEEPRRELAVLAKVLARLEREQFSSPLLVELRAGLDADGAAASRRLAHLDRLAYLLELPANQLFAPFAIASLWPLHAAHALERWRARYGAHVPRWMDAVGALEALLSLATYAYEHPADPFPEFVEDGLVFDGRDMAHPILLEAHCVRNSITLDKDLRLLVVSGSNMSGKSTLLRTVGVNAVLAQAGAPVRAQRLRMAPLELGATLRVQDSLQAGASRFYAEIARLKQVMDLAEAAPTLFLFDEILSGTNSHDRRIGAAEVLRALIERGAGGIVTTHDLALTHIADQIGPIARNVHFTDEWRDGAIMFPYKLEPGVVQQGNALRLMARLGLPVKPDAPPQRQRPGNAPGPSQ